MPKGLWFKHCPADDPQSEDDEHRLMLNETWMGISIQDSRAYGGGYGVNKYGRECEESPFRGEDYFVKDCGTYRSLRKAKERALQLQQEAQSCPEERGADKGVDS